MKLYFKGSSVIEMAYVMPVVLFTWMGIIFVLFYYHDKSVLQGLVYEAAVVGSELWMEESELIEQRCYAYLMERVEGKMLFFGKIDAEITVGSECVEIHAGADKRGLNMQVEAESIRTDPTETLRRISAGREKIEDEINENRN